MCPVLLDHYKASRENKQGLTQTALRQFIRLYAIEKQIKDLPDYP